MHGAGRERRDAEIIHDGFSVFTGDMSFAGVTAVEKWAHKLGKRMMSIFGNVYR